MEQLEHLRKSVVTPNPKVVERLRGFPEAQSLEVTDAVAITLDGKRVNCTLVRHAWVGGGLLVLHLHLDESGALGDAPLVIVQIDPTNEESPYNLFVYKRDKDEGEFRLESAFDEEEAWIDL